MWPIRRLFCDSIDFRERDAKLQKLHSALSIARLQRNKHRANELTQEIRLSGG